MSSVDKIAGQVTEPLFQKIWGRQILWGTYCWWPLPCQHLHTYTCTGTAHCFTSPSAGCPPHFLASLVPGRNGRWGKNNDQGPTRDCIREKMLFINKSKRNLSFQSSSYCALNKPVTFSEKPQPVVR